ARAAGPRFMMQHRKWGMADALAVTRVDSDPAEPARLRAPAVALIGDAGPILRRLIDALPAHNAKRPTCAGEMTRRQAAWRQKLADPLSPHVAFLHAIPPHLPPHAPHPHPT